MAIEDDLSLAGVPYPLAVEILNSVKSGATTTPERLAAFGVPGPTAITLASQINTRNPSARVLIASGFAPQAAHVIKAAITSGAGGGVPTRPPVTLPTPVLMESFDNAGDFTATNGALLSSDTTNKVQGVASLRIGAIGTSGAPAATKANVFNGDPATLGTVAMLVDYGDDPEYRQCTGVDKRFGRGGTYLTTAGVTIQTASTIIRGKRWEAFPISKATNLIALGAGQLDLRVQTSHVSVYAETIRVDALMRNAAGRPKVGLWWDDSRRDPLTKALPIVKARCPALARKMMLAVCTGLIGDNDIGNRMDWNDVRAAKAEGFALGLNLTPNDLAINTFASPEAVRDAWLAAKQTMIAQGCDGGNDMNHTVASNGTLRVAGTAVNGGATTRNGTNQVTVATATGITVGMKASGYLVPAGTTVTAVSGSTITLSTVIPTSAANEPMLFTDTSGPFHTDKLWPVVSAAGVKTIRQTNPGIAYTRGGLGQLAEAFPAQSFSQGSGVTAQTVIDATNEAIAVGGTLMCYNHFIDPSLGLGMTEQNFSDLCDFWNARWNANEIDFATMSDVEAADGLAVHAL